MAPSPCDATATSHHPARFCCSTCTGSIRRALHMTTASPLLENNLEHWQLPAITPFKVEQCKISLRRHPLHQQCQAPHRVFLLSNISIVSRGSGPDKGTPQTPDLARQTHCLPSIQNQHPRGDPTPVPELGFKTEESSHCFSYLELPSLCVSYLLSAKATWLTGDLSFTFLTGLAWKGSLAGACSSLPGPDAAC